MAKQITDISGRGVGLDVVKSGIEQLGGDVSVSTELGKGTTFTVRLPLTLAIIQALMVEIRDEIYAIALGSISNIEDIPVKDIKYVQAKEVIHLRGSVIPIIRLDKMLDIEPKEQEPKPRVQTSFMQAKSIFQTKAYDSVFDLKKGMPAKAGSLDYAVGDTVRHIKFGVGIVEKIEDGGRDYEVTVNFEKCGVKKMFAAFAKLKKL